MRMDDQNKHYWTNRTLGYSKVNEEELQSSQKNKWSEALLSMLPKADKPIRVLDIGTGPGFFAIILSEHHFDVTALDGTPSMIERAQLNAGPLKDNINWVISDAHSLPFESDTFDAIVTRNVTWNLSSPRKAYEEWLRVLKKGGQLINFDANWYQHLFDVDMRRAYEQDREYVKELSLEDHYTCTDIDEMEAIAKKLPLGREKRPQWDQKILQALGASRVQSNPHIWRQVWSDEEVANYRSTPMFSVVAIK